MSNIFSVTTERNGELHFPSKENFLSSNNIASIDDIKQKANSGVLHFESGSTLTCLQNIGLPKAFSLCRTFAFSISDWVSIQTVNNGYFDYNYYNVTTTGTGYNGYAFRNNGGDLIFYISYNGLLAITIVVNNTILSEYLDGKPHCLCVCSDGSNVKLYIDKTLIKSANSANLQNVSIARNTFTYRPIGEYSRIYHFNFDITTENAPYTLEDYQQGKPIPPKAFEYLNQNVAELPIDPTLRTGLSGTPVNQISHWDRNATISVNGDAITWTATDTSTGYPRAIVYKFAKALTGSGFLKIDIGNVSKTGTLETMRIAIFDSAGAISYPTDTGFGFDKGELSLSIPYTNGLSAIAIGTGSSWTAGDSFTIDYLKVEHNGTILALEDYTINGKVLDYSGNNNHATVANNIKGSLDTKLNKFVDEVLEETKASVTQLELNNSVNTKNISDLQLFKANTGALHFNGGYVKGNSTAFKDIYNSLTVLQTVKIDNIDLSDKQTDRLFSLGLADIEVYNDDLTIGFNSNQVIISVAYSTSKHSDISNRLSIYKYNTDAFNRLNDGKYHTIAVVFQVGDYLKFYIDGEFIYQTDTITPYSLNLSTNQYGYGVGGRPHSTSMQVFKHGEISRTMVFNFNTVSEDAPYTIADYQQGKSIPPKAFYGQDSFVGGIEQSYSWLRTGLTMTSNITFDENGTNFIFDNTNGTSADYQIVAFDVNIPKGAYLTAEGDWSNIYSVMAYNNSTNIGQIIATGNVITPLTLSADCTALRIRPLSTGAGSTRTITLPPSCKIKVNGAILALEDYTINGKVLDYSGNKNHATITGDVEGNKDIHISTLIENISTPSVLLTSPDNSLFKLTIDNNGAILTEKI